MLAMTMQNVTFWLCIIVAVLAGFVVGRFVR